MAGLLLLLSGDVETNPGPLPSMPSMEELSTGLSRYPTLIRWFARFVNLKNHRSIKRLPSMPALPYFDKRDQTEALQSQVEDQMDQIRGEPAALFCHSTVVAQLTSIIKVILYSDLKELLEKQTEMILNIQTKLEDYRGELSQTNAELEKSKECYEIFSLVQTLNFFSFF